MSEKQKEILDKIRKLLRLAESDNQHEAELAYANAQKLITKYNIDKSMLEEQEDELIEVITFFKFRNLQLIHHLTYQLLEAFYNVKGYVFHNKLSAYRGQVNQEMKFIGTKMDLDMAKYASDFFRFALDTAFAEWQEETDCPNSHRNDFYLGMFEGITGKMQAAKMQEEEANLTTEERRSRYAIVIQKKSDAIDEFMRKLGSTKQPTNFHAGISLEARKEGQRQGERTHINKPIAGGPAKGVTGSLV